MARELLNVIKDDRPNLLINGAMDFRQRSSSAETIGTASGEYLVYDRWRVGANVTASPTVQPNLAQLDNVNLSPEGPFTAKECMRLTADFTAATGSFFRLRQRVEFKNVQELARKGSPVSVGFWLWVDDLDRVTVRLEYPGADDSWGTQTTFATRQQDITTTGSWQYYKFENIPLNLNAQAGLQLTIDIESVNVTATASNAYITEIMLNEGSSAAPFRRAGETIAEELQLCQRYYEKSYDIDAAPGTVGSTGYCVYNIELGNQTNPVANWSYKVRKRVNPTLQIYSPVTGVSGALYRTETAADISGFTFQGNQTSGGVGWSSHAGPQPLTYHWTADAEL